MDVNDVKIGTYVRTNYGLEGRVYRLQDSCPESVWWLDLQNDPRMAERKDEKWASVLVHDGGSVCAPVSLLEELEPFDFENPYADEYFAEVDATPEAEVAARAFRDFVEWNGTIATLGLGADNMSDLLEAAFLAGWNHITEPTTGDHEVRPVGEPL